MAQNTQYVCVEFLQPVGRGAMSCKTWQELQISQPIPPSITKEQADEITIAVLQVVFLAFGWFLIIRLTRILL